MPKPQRYNEYPLPVRTPLDETPAQEIRARVYSHSTCSHGRVSGGHGLLEDDNFYEQLGIQVSCLVMSLANRDELFQAKADFIRKLEAELDHLRHENIILKQQQQHHASPLPRMLNLPHQPDLSGNSANASSGGNMAYAAKIGGAQQGAQIGAFSSPETPVPPMPFRSGGASVGVPMTPPGTDSNYTLDVPLSRPQSPLSPDVLLARPICEIRNDFYAGYVHFSPRKSKRHSPRHSIASGTRPSKDSAGETSFQRKDSPPGKYQSATCSQSSADSSADKSQSGPSSGRSCRFSTIFGQSRRSAVLGPTSSSAQHQAAREALRGGAKHALENCKSTSGQSVRASVVVKDTLSNKTRKSAPPEEYRLRLIQIFDRLDEDQSGQIQVEELRHALRATGSPPAHARRLMAMADRNNDASVDREEWTAMIDDLIQGKGIDSTRIFLEDCLRMYDTQQELDAPLPKIQQYCLISYRSGFRVMWDMMLTVFLAYISVMTPYEIGIQKGEINVFFKVLNVFVDIVFITDVFLNFRTTYVDRNGDYVTDGSRIAKHYLRSWFLLDFVSSLPVDYLTGDVSASFQVAKIGKTGKLLKIAKIWRLTKIAQIAWVSHLIEEGQDFLAVSGMGTLVQLLAVLMGAALVCHWLACFMMLSSTTGYLESYMGGAYMASGPSKFSQYVAAQYWAVTTMTTVGYGDITPDSDGERAYAILAMFAGGAFYSYVIGYMAVVAGNRNLNERAYQHRLREVRAWLDHNDFSRIMRHRIWRYFRKHLRAKSVTETFSIIGDLSPELRQAVSLILVPETVRINVIFVDAPAVVIIVLASIIKKVLTDEAEPIASFGDYGYAMCVIISGSAVIDRSGMTVKSRKDAAELLKTHVDSQVLLPSDSFGEEIILGLESQYSYSVVSASLLQMAMIPADDFLRQFSSMPDVIQRMRQHYFIGHV